MCGQFNENKQHTISSAFDISGVGLHTGTTSVMRLYPADEDFGYKFKRIDLNRDLFIDADCDLVNDTSRGTTINQKGASVSTVEHLLAALVAKGVDNCIIEIDGPEVPILDGSSFPFIQAIEKVGVLEQNVEKKWYKINEQITVRDEEKGAEMSVSPCFEYQITASIDFNSDVLGVQTVSLDHICDFRENISRSRTFCFLHELEFLSKNNLIRGGSLDNALVVVNRAITKEEADELSKLFNKKGIEIKKGYLNNVDLRYENEPVRHKLLDIVGDLSLVGFAIKGKIFAKKPGHRINIDLARKIKNYIKNSYFLK